MPPAADDTIVVPGGPGEDPPPTGVIMRLIDPTGTIAHETAFLPPIPPEPVTTTIDEDGTRALVLPASGTGFTPGWWTLALTASPDPAPDMPQWTRAGQPAAPTAHLRFRIGPN